MAKKKNRFLMCNLCAYVAFTRDNGQIVIGCALERTPLQKCELFCLINVIYCDVHNQRVDRRVCAHRHENGYEKCGKCSVGATLKQLVTEPTAEPTKPRLNRRGVK